MKKNRNRSEVSLPSVKSETQCKEEIFVPPLDELNIKVLDFRVPDKDPERYSLKIIFFDQLLLFDVITSSNYRENKEKKTITCGFMNYDPSDYEKMCLFADNPLTIKIHAFKSMENLSSALSSTPQSQSNKSSVQCTKTELDGYCCNIDILPIFIGKEKMIFKRRLEPITPPSVLLSKSWDNLPEITISVISIKNQENMMHHKKFKDINFMKVSLVGSYNMYLPYDDNFVYSAATKLPMENEMHTGVFTFSRGYKTPKRFNNFSFYPHWESLRITDEPFTKGNSKLEINLANLQNEENIDFKNYVNKFSYTTIWGSFHRSLMLKNTEEWLSKHIRTYKWPLELCISVENNTYSFMGFIDLFKLLYPGEKTARLVVPLQWMDRENMIAKCGCEFLLTNNEKGSTTMVQKASKATSDSVNVTDSILTARPTGSDGNCAFVIIEVSLAKPFRKPVIPSHISQSDIKDMLLDMELKPIKRECTGRGQLDRNWQMTVRNAANSLRRVPYFGLTDLCTVNRQLAGSRTRVELLTSFWQDAAIYTNNNFVVNEFLHSDDTFEEMIMITHACLMRIANDLLTGSDNVRENSTLKAARHARQLQDLPHAVKLYLQLIVESPRDANSWRELSTCLKDVDSDWANACINKAIMLNPRHPLSLLSKSCMIFDENPEAAEPFFMALLALYPFWIPLYICVSAYFLQRELFHMSNQIMEQVKKTQREGLSEDLRFPRAWERELGDWWDNTPLLPGTNLYYDAADLLLRIRAISLAEVCIARAFTETGECPVYYHLVALCCRLKGRIGDTLCHLKEGIEKFGEISYLRSLEGECYHKQKAFGASMTSFSKVANSGPYIVLLSLPRCDHLRTGAILSDLVRRHPSAYAFMAFADFWITRSAMGEGGDAEMTEEQKIAMMSAMSCCTKALKCDRRVGRAWTMLATLVKPSERRQYCKEMAAMCDYMKPTEERSKANLKKKESLCYTIGKALRECRCKMCDILTL